MPGRVQSVERAAAILRLLAGSPDGMRVSDLARCLSLPKTTVHGLLQTLRHVGFVEQDARSRHYHLGQALRRLDTTHIDANELRSRTINWADPLAAYSGQAVRVGVLHEGEVLVVHHVFRPHDSQTTLDIGRRLPLHATALGKVLLAYDPRAARTLDGDLEPFTPRTLTRPVPLRRALAELRAAGWGTGIGEWRVDTAAIAAPIRGYGGVVVGAIGVAGAVDDICDPRSRPRTALVTRVCEAAHAVSRDLQSTR